MLKKTMLPIEFQNLLENNDIDALKSLFETCNINAKISRAGTNAFAMYPLPREFAFWIKNEGMDINMPDKKGKTPVFYQIKSKNSGVPLLAELGADLHYLLPENNHSIYHEAVLVGDIEAIKIAIEQGVDINIESRFPYEVKNTTPLELFLKRDLLPVEYMEIVKLLIDNGAIVTRKINSLMGYTVRRFNSIKQNLDDNVRIENETALSNLFKILDIEEKKFDNEINLYRKNKRETVSNALDTILGAEQSTEFIQMEILDKFCDVKAFAKANNYLLDEHIQILKDIPEYLKIGNSLPAYYIKNIDNLIRNINKTDQLNTNLEKIFKHLVVWVMFNPNIIEK